MKAEYRCNGIGFSINSEGMTLGTVEGPKGMNVLACQHSKLTAQHVDTAPIWLANRPAVCLKICNIPNIWLSF
jgi:hypothetical protein